MTSIRRFLLIALLAMITLVNFFAALQGYRRSRQEAEALFDEQLADIAAVLAATTRRERVAERIDVSNRTTSLAFQVWDNGTLVVASDNAPPEAFAPFEAGYADVNFAGYRWRSYALKDEATRRWLLVAERADLRFVLAENVIVESVVPIIVGLLPAGLLIWITVGRGLAPLGALAEVMAEKRSEDLTPVSLPRPPAELAALIESINSLLRRLADAFEREKRFTEDAAHELRTPISVLKVQLHNALADRTEPDEALQAMGRTIGRIEHSVEQLLMLHRTNPEQFAARLTFIDLSAIARQVIAEFYPQIEARGQTIELDADNGVVEGDEMALRILLSNLIENASKYGGDGGVLRVSVDTTAETVAVIVEDSGPGVDEADRDRMLERYVRGSADELGGNLPGSGIGLSLVKRVADMHHARLELGDSRFESGLMVKVVLPRVHRRRDG